MHTGSIQINILVINQTLLLLFVYIFRIRKIAKARTESQYQESVEALKCNPIWKNKLKLQQWFERVWLANYKV